MKSFKNYIAEAMDDNGKIVQKLEKAHAGHDHYV